MDSLLKYAREVLQSQPFSRLLGTQLVSIAPGQVELRLDLSDRLLQQHGFAHGGVISYLADNALTFAGGSVLGGNAVTGEFKINFLRPAIGTCLIARARVIYAGKLQAVSQCDVYVVHENEEKSCATALGTSVKIQG